MSEVINSGESEDNNSLRILANTHESLAITNEGLAERASETDKHLLGLRAKEHHIKALQILRQLDAKKALSEYDRKLIEQLEQTVKKYQQ